MKKSAIVLFVAALFSVQAMAQSIQEGVNNLYAERYQSARTVFEKMTSANPNNLEATYWLGQTYIAQGDVAAAKSLYQKALTANGNAPWILVGAGHVDLLEGRSAEARQRFEAAITASKGKKANDANILNAIGRANVQAYTDEKRLGDLEYAISKLNEAGQIAPNNPDIFVNLGNAYRKMHRGGDAVQAYRKAGNFAPALHRMAELYKTQENWDVVVENLNATVAADPRFAPALFDLYYYNLLQKRDFATAESFANKYISVADPSVENDYLRAQTLWVQNKFTEAADIANKIVAQTNNNPKPRVFRLLADSYLKLKDTARACEFSNRFFTKATQEELLGNDYLIHAVACGRNDPAIVEADVTKAVMMDSVLTRQLKMVNTAIVSARQQNQPLLEATLMLVSHRLRGTQANPADLFYIGTRYYSGGNFAKADSVLGVYATAFPDSVQGFYWKGLTQLRIDTAMTQGLAIPDFEKTLQLAERDKARFKTQGVQAAQILATYYNNVKSDRALAIATVAKGLEFDPADPNLNALKDQLTGGKKTKTETPDGTKVKVKDDGQKIKTKTPDGQKTKTKPKGK